MRTRPPGAATPSSGEAAASAAGPHLRDLTGQGGPAPGPGPASSPTPAPAAGRRSPPRGPARRAPRSTSGAALWQPKTRPLAPRLLPGSHFPGRSLGPPPAARSAEILEEPALHPREPRSLQDPGMSRKEEKQNFMSLL
ncbi:sterile alpha motif domain-containing protein 1-like [Acinonyx jubatus]|uniref:Sterile alpha motif domain-containing protein 1-like n=1 Tax=Acinonyx jubatus TaxID=32536 RepID=A0ABM3QG25_ACIJB|nr:sterile alpha motif domain-containing protein 1-like [Acinonyx jubatus]